MQTVVAFRVERFLVHAFATALISVGKLLRHSFLYSNVVLEEVKC